MSKYIRTKDGVYEVIKEEETRVFYLNKKIKAKDDNYYATIILKNEIINQADTIEELCDGFVMISEDYDLPQLVCKMNFDYVKKQCKYKAIYGAIWTDKGLIYVAKMNNKGELELI